MKFDVSRVYTALNADELKVGSKVICADSLGCLKRCVVKTDTQTETETLKTVEDADCQYRFVVQDDSEYALAYLVSEPEEKKLKVSDLKLGDVVRYRYGNIRYLILGIDQDENKIFFGDGWTGKSDLINWEKVED